MRYVKVHMTTGVILDEFYSDNEISDFDAVLVDDDFQIASNKRYINGKWEYFENEEGKIITEQDQLNAELLLNQATILENQQAHDEVLAEILLNQAQVGGNENV